MTIRFGIWDQVTGVSGQARHTLSAGPGLRPHHDPTPRQTPAHPTA